jgi:cysteinyl-tRNA synthetase
MKVGKGDMKLFNSLTNQIEEFSPRFPPKVGMYTCGPTVYDYVTIGNWRTYMLGDLLVRTLNYLGYSVDYIMNITDVGHLTGDNVGDADLGEDRMEEAARREKRSAWDLAQVYTEDFFEGLEKLNLVKPRKFTKATDHIKEQIELAQAIERQGFTYKIDDGIYFDTKAYEAAGNKYGELSTLDQIKEGARVEANPDKKDARDFALWKFSPKDEKREMEWDSPWGKGFPGWHIECSAMSMKYLGEQFDIHVGGEDLRSTHHPNEIAQAEAATGKKPFVRYWVHGAFLLVDGGRMGKSLGNAYTLHDIEKKGFDPMALRYFYLTGDYRKQLNFTWDGLGAASGALGHLRHAVLVFRGARERTVLSEEKLTKVQRYRKKFQDAIENDLSIPEALGVVWEVAKSNIPNYDKYDLLMDFDQVLGLRLAEAEEEAVELDEETQVLIDKREELRQQGKFKEADKLREEIAARGYILEDTPEGPKIRKR